TLIRIRKTLTRIKLGRFGICEECKHMIDPDRLAIDPTATLCIDCAKKNAA
ncbi:TraR/DksA C4-type zinc finger protein, partial [Patescibacteria group bacterium]|nr:TraR/DksA C4-type zinc finger protein [Patescibacteria group bacterium]